uniref:Uncharacterized protein n=1 Tax=viral metagenome TaxID=1070528 RepID=A0A6C0KF06_9ZZZZ
MARTKQMARMSTGDMAPSKVIARLAEAQRGPVFRDHNGYRKRRRCRIVVQELDEWQHGKPHGQGKETYLDGAVIVVCHDGAWQDGKPHGQGTMTAANGCGAVYDGQGKYQGEYHGQGKYTYPGGGVYEGEWRGGKRHGQGKKTYPDGDVYEGEWRDGRLIGFSDATLGKRFVGHVSDEAFAEEAERRGYKRQRGAGAAAGAETAGSGGAAAPEPAATAAM